MDLGKLSPYLVVSRQEQVFFNRLRVRTLFVMSKFTKVGPILPKVYNCSSYPYTKFQMIERFIRFHTMSLKYSGGSMGVEGCKGD